MQRVTETAFFKNIRDTRKFWFGKFYFFDSLIIGEIAEGVAFTLDLTQRVIEEANKIIGADKDVAYISNRVNSYTFHLTDWFSFRKTEAHKRLKAYAIVAYTERVHKNFLLESGFATVPIKKFNSLDDAVDWCLKKVPSQTTI